MKHLIGMQSNAFPGDNEFGIDFKKFQKLGINSLDYQGLISLSNPSSPLHLTDEEFNAYFLRLKKEIVSHHLVVNQLHALWDPDYESLHHDEDMFIYYEKAVVAAFILNTKYVVIHGVPLKNKILWDVVDPIELKKTNILFLNHLLPIARKYGVYIALENLPFTQMGEYFSPSGTLKFIQEINDPNLVMCLDTGHLNIFPNEDIYSFLKRGKDKIKCLHMHDNNGQSDSHSFPYFGSFDWHSFIRGLKDINFQGVLSLETKVPLKITNKKAYEELNNGLISTLKQLRDELDVLI